VVEVELLQALAGEVASRVVGAYDHNDPTRPPPACAPQRVRQALLPSRRPLRPAGSAARPPPRRLPPGDDPALPSKAGPRPRSPTCWAMSPRRSARRPRGPGRPRGSACRWSGPAGPPQRGTPAGRADEFSARGPLPRDWSSPASRCPPERVNSSPSVLHSSGQMTSRRRVRPAATWTPTATRRRPRHVPAADRGGHPRRATGYLYRRRPPPASPRCSPE
jgi:hypothetical protein